MDKKNQIYMQGAPLHSTGISRVILWCPECGSTNISCDATASWNVTAQKWELAALLDNMDCTECGYDSNNAENFEHTEEDQ